MMAKLFRKLATCITELPIIRKYNMVYLYMRTKYAFNKLPTIFSRSPINPETLKWVSAMNTLCSLPTFKLKYSDVQFKLKYNGNTIMELET